MAGYTKNMKSASNKKAPTTSMAASLPLMALAALAASLAAYYNVVPELYPLETRVTNTTMLASCGGDVEELNIAHAKLGFNAAELLENVAKPLEKAYLNATAERDFKIKQAKYVINTNVSGEYGQRCLPSSEKIGQAMRNATESLMNVDVKNIPNMTQNITLPTGSTISATVEAAANATKTALACGQRKAGAVLDSAATLLDQTVEKGCDCELHRKLAAEMDVVRKGRLTKGALRFSLNDAVKDMNGIFATCSPPKKQHLAAKHEQALRRRFPSSKMQSATLSEGVVMTTTVSDGWTMEARVYKNLWTDIIVTRGDFSLAVRRNKVGLLHAEVTGFDLGEI